MMKTNVNLLLAGLMLTLGLSHVHAQRTTIQRKPKQEMFPDGKTPVTDWFRQTKKIDIETLGKQYVVTDYGVKTDSTLLQTKQLQAVIDRCSREGGGVIVIPKGTFLTGALFFKKGTHLHLEADGKLKGIDAIKHYPLIDMHMEGLPVKYFAALITAEYVDGFTITGPGTIDGNAKRFWEEFWIRRQFNRQCTNLEALRPQLVYISHSNDVTLQDARFVNSAFWTTHLYRCDRVKYLNCHIESPASGNIKAPSSDGIDLDVCQDVLVRECYINVCDDGVCMKGGRGTYVDRDSTAGKNHNIIVEKCVFGNHTNAGITMGSDSWYNSNVIMRDCHFENSWHVILFKMRPDTPQTYEYVRVENCTGSCNNAIEASTWTQFHTPVEREDMPVSRVDNIVIKDMNVKCRNKFLQIKRDHKFDLVNFTFENICAESKDGDFNVSDIEGCKVKNVKVKKINPQDLIYKTVNF